MAIFHCYVSSPEGNLPTKKKNRKTAFETLKLFEVDLTCLSCPGYMVRILAHGLSTGWSMEATTEGGQELWGLESWSLPGDVHPR
jgi:hypothetical protein